MGQPVSKPIQSIKQAHASQLELIVHIKDVYPQSQPQHFLLKVVCSIFVQQNVIILLFWPTCNLITLLQIFICDMIGL